MLILHQDVYIDNLPEYMKEDWVCKVPELIILGEDGEWKKERKRGREKKKEKKGERKKKERKKGREKKERKKGRDAINRSLYGILWKPLADTVFRIFICMSVSG